MDSKKAVKKKSKMPFDFIRRAALWTYKNKFVSFLLIFSACYIATIPLIEPKVSTSTERADIKSGKE
jgi:hypothetical protein